MQENDAYILGTDQEELDRLKIQHQVWRSEAERGWKLANFKSGNNGFGSCWCIDF